MQTVKTLIRLGGWSESSLGAHSFCWFCHVAAQLSLLILAIQSKKLIHSLDIVIVSAFILVNG